MGFAFNTSIADPDCEIGAVILTLFAIYAGIFVNYLWISIGIKIQNRFGAYVHTYTTLFTKAFVKVNGVQFFFHIVTNKDKTGSLACQGMMLDL
jgi:hypothetical protein